MAEIRDLVGQLFMIDFTGHEPSPEVERLIAGEGVGGVIVFDKNIAAPRQIAALTNALQEIAATAGRPALLGGPATHPPRDDPFRSSSASPGRPRPPAGLRERFPELPFVALTATVTDRIRDNIVERHAIRLPQVYVPSFNRTNLSNRFPHNKRNVDSLID